MIIQHNMAAMFANRELNISEKNRATSAEKLSSGYRINKAADDAAGLTISEKMRWQIRGLDKASNNIEDGMSLIQIADGALNESHAVLQRMNELAVQAANDTNTDADRDAIQLEMDELADELTRIAESTTYNSEIYPLASEGVTKIQMPSSFSEVTLTFINDIGWDVLCDGVTYKNGETITLNNVLWYNNPSGGYGSVIGLGMVNDTGGFQPRTTTSRIPNCTQAHKLTDVIQDSGYPDVPYQLVYTTAGDIRVDADGYVYIDGEYISGGWYPLSNGFRAIRDDTCLKAISTSNGRDEIKIQSGALAYQSVDIPLVDAKASTLGVEFLDVMTHTYATKAVDTINKAIEKVSEYRSMFGAVQNRLEHARANVDNTALNVQASESKLRDTNMAEEMVSNSSASIISQTAQSMLAQSNQMTQGVLKLLE